MVFGFNTARNIRAIQGRQRQKRDMDRRGARREPYYAGEIIGWGDRPRYLGNRLVHPSMRIMPYSALYGQGGLPERLFPDGSAKPGFGPPPGPGYGPGSNAAVYGGKRRSQPLRRARSNKAVSGAPGPDVGNLANYPHNEFGNGPAAHHQGHHGAQGGHQPHGHGHQGGGGAGSYVLHHSSQMHNNQHPGQSHHPGQSQGHQAGPGAGSYVPYHSSQMPHSHHSSHSRHPTQVSFHGGFDDIETPPPSYHSRR
ncbi:hypothetical protein MMC14_000582 [Varicellaria rhodocarpa]|nr:hypothetical protein [Varicellaria rhodocarpa]